MNNLDEREKPYKLIRDSLPKQQQKTTGIYFHYPFCKTKCSYCHFSSRVYDSWYHRLWLTGVKTEIQAAAGYFSDQLVLDTIYFGGGTPSFLAPEEISDLIVSLQEYFASKFEEITLEVSPDAEETRIPGWLQAGVTRLSFGAQSFDPKILAALGRTNSPEQVFDLTGKAKQAGCKNINIDLIIGVPGESHLTQEINLKGLKSISPEHISVYILEEISKVPFKNLWEKSPLSDEEVADSYETYRVALANLGWEQYEISNFSKPGFNCLHNLKYWKYQAFLGLGPSASSHLGSFRWSNCNHLSAWLASLKSPGSIFSEFIYLEPEVAIREALASGLRLKEGINWDELKQAYPEFNFSVYQEKIRQLEAEGLLKYESSYLSIPADKLLISNSIIADLIF